MRKELYQAIANKLLFLQGGELIKHVDLWNENVVFIEQEEAWPRPAVFVEFGPITWEPLKEITTQRGCGMVKLHVVTDWNGSTANGGTDGAFSALELSQTLQNALEGMTTARTYALNLQETHTNHNHEDIVESIEVYRVRYTRILHLGE